MKRKNKPIKVKIRNFVAKNALLFHRSKIEKNKKKEEKKSPKLTKFGDFFFYAIK